MLELPDVTIWTMVWTENRKWIRQAGQVLRYCARIMRPARLVLFTNEEVAKRDYPFDVVRIPKLDWQSYNIFVNRIVPTHLHSDFAMSVHEDGFPLEVSLWRPEFLEYDYIGAPWDDGMVGNGGFNIESRRLMDLKCAMPVAGDEFCLPSDRLVCTARRSYFEERGVRFAPQSLALAFSTEQVGGDQPSFGFHGRNVSAEKYRRGWQIIHNMNAQLINGMWLQRNRVVPPPSQQVRRKPQGGVMVRPLDPVKLPALADLTATVVYVYPQVAGEKYHRYAKRFVETYLKFPPGRDHETFVMLNGGSLNHEAARLFEVFPRCTFIQHDNSGYDLGAFQKACRKCSSDMIVFFGASTWLNVEGWLERMAEAFVKHGHGLYGAMGNRGDARYHVFPHIRTTAFWMHPSLLNVYPRAIRRAAERYAFEHGQDCFTNWVTRRGLRAWVVTRAGEYEWENWDDDPKGYQRGDQSNMLAGDHICEPPYYPK